MELKLQGVKGVGGGGGLSRVLAEVGHKNIFWLLMFYFEESLHQNPDPLGTKN